MLVQGLAKQHQGSAKYQHECGKSAHCFKKQGGTLGAPVVEYEQYGLVQKQVAHDCGGERKDRYSHHWDKQLQPFRQGVLDRTKDKKDAKHQRGNVGKRGTGIYKRILCHTPTTTTQWLKRLPQATVAHMDEEKPAYPMRINKYLANHNYCTRREADAYIERGKVLINGRKAVLGDKIQETDKVEVLFAKKNYRYFAYHKPKGVVTHSPEEDQVSVVQSLPMVGVFPLGRLDKESHGLMILTDDGRITDDLLNPNYAHQKEYVVRTNEVLPSFFKKRMEAGVDIEGYTTKPCEIDIVADKKFKIRLTEGKRHQIRRMCAAMGVTIADLLRSRIMSIQLGKLAPGEYRAIAGRELKDFLEQLGTH